MKAYRLFFLSVFFLLLFNEPLVSIVNRPVLVAGIPVLYLYIVIMWLLLIGGIIYVIYGTETITEPPTDE